MEVAQKHLSPFHLYNASAGSGKTFALTVAYLKKILQPGPEDAYKRLLAITFTNKAVAEMKSRILSTLEAFAQGNFQGNAGIMAGEVLRDSSMTHAGLQSRSQIVLNHLLHHYAQFHVETIDRFNHRLLKTFSKDLKLSSNFEVSLETGLLLSEAVDRLIDQAGRDEKITQLLVAFALSKTEENKSWDIAFDLNQIAWMIVQENDAPYLALLKDIPLDDFNVFAEKLRREKSDFDQAMQDWAKEALALCSDHGIEAEHFSRKWYVQLMNKVLDPKSKPNFDTVTISGFLKDSEPGQTDKVLYKKDTPKEVKAIMDELHSTLIDYLKRIHRAYVSSTHLNNTLSQLVPLTLVALIEKEFEQIKKETNTLVISDFNRLLGQEIQSQPAPFIYERLGARFTHYFIDEFQDTSILQWQNLLPLIENNLAQADPERPKHSLMLVGDPKQSIYRWRGGHPEQFIALSENQNHELPAPEVIPLETNFRSRKDIVEFNNQLYSFAADYLPSHRHGKIYKEGNNQKFHHQDPGLVSIEFLEDKDKTAEHSDTRYLRAIDREVAGQIERGRTLSDLCILTRDNKKCSAIGAYLTEQGYRVISEEALLLKNNKVVMALIDLAYLSAYPNQKRPKVRLGNLLYQTHNLASSQMTFLKRISHSDSQSFGALLSELGIDFDLAQMAAMGLYDRFAYALNQFNWSPTSNAYIAHFLDWVFQYGKRPQATIWKLLTQWEQDKDKLSLSSASGQEAIQIMTIHKAKGLEFPVVILPYAHERFSPQKVGRVWYPFHEEGFDHLPVRYSAQLSHYSPQGQAIADDLREKAFFDTLNLYYVATTRATQELYIMADMPPDNQKSLAFNGLLRDFLEAKGRQTKAQFIHQFGTKPEIKSSEQKPVPALLAPLKIVRPEDHPITLVPQRRISDYWFDAGVGFGSLFHELMALILRAEDSDEALSQIAIKYRLDQNQKQRAKALVLATIHHPELKPLFYSDDQVLVERSIITPEGVRRPDRINLSATNQAVVLDYKTGVPKPEDIDQIRHYGAALEAMGIQVRSHLIVYLREDPIVVNKF